MFECTDLGVVLYLDSNGFILSDGFYKYPRILLISVDSLIDF